MSYREMRKWIGHIQKKVRTQISTPKIGGAVLEKSGVVIGVVKVWPVNVAVHGETVISVPSMEQERRKAGLKN